MKGNEKQFELAGNSSYRGKFQWNFDQRKGNLVREEFELSELEFLRGWGGGEGRAPDPSFPLIFHENPASRTVFHHFPESHSLKKKLIAAKVNNCKMQIDCEQSLIFLCKVTARETQEGRLSRLVLIPYCNIRSWFSVALAENQTDFKRKGGLQAV